MTPLTLEPRQQPSPQCNQNKRDDLGFHSHHCPININGVKVEMVQGFKYLGVHIGHNATCTANTSLMEKKGLQRLLKKARLPQQLLENFDRSVIESVITCCIAVWYSGCTSENKKSLQWIIETAEKITSSPVWRTFTGHVAFGRPRDPSHPGHNMFTRLHLGNVTEHCMPTQQDLKIYLTIEQLLY